MEQILPKYIAACQDHDYETLRTIVPDIINDYLSLDDYIYSMCVLLQACQDRETFRYVLDTYQDQNLEQEFHVINMLTQSSRCPDSVIIKCREWYSEVGLMELLDQWIGRCYTDATEFGIRRLFRIYSNPGKEAMKRLCSITESRDQGPLINLFREFLSHVNDYADQPTWIDDSVIITPQRMELALQQLHNTSEHQLTINDALNYLKQASIDVAEDETLQALDNQVEQLNNTEKHMLIQTVSNLIEGARKVGDEELALIFGPSNPFAIPYLNDDYSSGQDRMLLCNFYDHDPETGEEFDWFSGSCDVCDKRIRARHHCVRMPIPSGGWEGCFCSWQHAKDYAHDRYTHEAEYIEQLIDGYAHHMRIYERENFEYVEELTDNFAHSLHIHENESSE